jgi:hypothetical protein
MVFIELNPFIEFRLEYWTDEDLRTLQNHLLINPMAGDVLQGGQGLRKIRWAAQGRGKRSGARVIYFYQSADDRIYLVHGYVKSEQADLTPAQTKQLAELMKGMIEHGHSPL